MDNKKSHGLIRGGEAGRPMLCGSRRSERTRLLKITKSHGRRNARGSKVKKWGTYLLNRDAPIWISRTRADFDFDIRRVSFLLDLLRLGLVELGRVYQPGKSLSSDGESCRVEILFFCHKYKPG